MTDIIIDGKNRKLLESIPSDKEIIDYIKTLSKSYSIRSDGLIIIHNSDGLDKQKIKTDLGLTE